LEEFERNVVSAREAGTHLFVCVPRGAGDQDRVGCLRQYERPKRKFCKFTHHYNTHPRTTMSESLPNTKNVLASDVEIKGSIKFQNDLTIDGKVEGEIISPGVLVVGENAEIRGEIKTKGVTVLGKVHGNITVEERCELKSHAVLHGDLKASRLVIEDGATFVGKSEVTPNRIAMKAPEIVRAPEAARPAAGGMGGAPRV
jgi:cytoskeletal protein CcmA (bactofilin family)